MVKVLGIDEAGRGPVIGPLVITGYSLDSSTEKELLVLGVKDSKMLTAKKRNEIYEKLITTGLHKTIIVEPKEIDEALQSEGTNLNWLEADKCIEIINALKPEVVYLDCPSPNLKAFKDYVLSRLNDQTTEVIAQHKADVDFPSVAAASIIAKVTRDKLIERIKLKYDINFGSGYPSDPLTKEFILENWKKYDIFRKSWSSYKEVAKWSSQKRLGDW